jgi:hypothetical protein
MSTIFNIRNLKLPGVSQTALVVGTVVVLAIVGGLIGWNVYKKLTTNTVVAYSPTRWLCIPATGSRSWESRSARSTRSSPRATR